MTIDADVILKIAGFITTIAGAGAIVYKAATSCINKYIDKKLTPLIKWTQNQQNDINDAAERDAILIEAQLASMEAIHKGENNGNVSAAIVKLRAYTTRKASEPSSYAKL